MAADAANSVDIGTLISRSPDYRRNQARITGTGVRVMRVVIEYNLGHTPEEIAIGWGHLTLAQVHAALAYYFANKAEVDADIAEEEAAWEAVEREHSQNRKPD